MKKYEIFINELDEFNSYNTKDTIEMIENSLDNNEFCIINTILLLHKQNKHKDIVIEKITEFINHKLNDKRYDIISFFYFNLFFNWIIKYEYMNDIIDSNISLLIKHQLQDINYEIILDSEKEIDNYDYILSILYSSKYNYILKNINVLTPKLVEHIKHFICSSSNESEYEWYKYISMSNFN